MRVVIGAALALLGLFLIITQFGSDTSSRGPEINHDELILSALSLIPDNANSRTLAAVNLYELARERLELESPDGESVNQVVDYAFFMKTRGGMEDGPLISGFDDNFTITLAVMRENAGYDMSDVAASIWAGLGNEVYGAALLFEAMPALYDKMRTSSAWPDPVAGSHKRIRTLSWGEELQADPVQQFNPPVYNQLGQPSSIAFSSGVLMSALRISEVKGMIDTLRNATSSLADDELYVQLAEGAKNLKLYSIVFSGRSQSLTEALSYIRQITVDDEQFEERKEELENEPMLVPYEAFATGIGRDELGRFYMGLVLVHQDEVSARDNVNLLPVRLSGEGVNSWKKEWNELFDLEMAEYVAEGNLLLAKVPLEENRASTIWLDWFYSQDYLLLHP